MTSDRRHLLLLIAAAGLMAAVFPALGEPASAPAAIGLRSIVVLDFELVDERNNPATKAAQEVRLRNATAQLQRELAERQLYRVVDPAPSQDLQRTLREQQEFLYRCEDCAAQIGQVLHADLVMATWVQKVSELILNVNGQVYDVKAQRVLMSNSVDMRGNNDESWARAVSYLVRNMAEKRARNPAYGQ